MDILGAIIFVRSRRVQRISVSFVVHVSRSIDHHVHQSYLSFDVSTHWPMYFLVFACFY